MNDWTTLIYVLAPAILVAVTVFFVIQKMLNNDLERRNVELYVESRRISLPIRLQAYERLSLFLERIAPDSLILRVSKPNMKTRDLHLALLTNIREEYEYNLSQQIYVTPELWAAIRAAKESIITHINESATESNPEGASLEFSRLIIESYVEDGKDDLIGTAKIMLSKEVKKLF